MNKYYIAGKNPVNNFKQTLKIMRITLFLLFFGILFSQAATGYSQDVELTLNLNSTSIKKICEEIEKQSDFRFIFAGNAKKIINKKVDLTTNSKNIEEILDNILTNTQLTYRILDNQIVVFLDGSKNVQKEIETIVSELIIQQQKKQITGKVTDEQGEPIIGANIIEKGTTNGTITGIDGKFSLNVEENATLRISYIGYMPQDISTIGKTTINIVLQEDMGSLGELVVIGYGTMKKSDLTGSVASIASDKIINRPSSNVLQTMQGNIPGVIITKRSAEPQASSDIYIRGLNSISASNAPLVVIDGIPGSIDNISPNDIESIDVLKDASSCAIYGARGSNGVVLVTTKKGSGKPVINYNTYYGIKQPANLIDLMDGEKELYYKQRFFELAGRPSEPINILPREEYQNYLLGRQTDWQDMIYRNALVYEHNLSFSGTLKNLNYFVSGNYLDHDYFEGKMNFTRKSIRVNVEYEFNDWLKIGNNLHVTEGEREGWSGGAIDAIRMSQWASPTDPDGNDLIYPIESTTTYVSNPLVKYTDELMMINNDLNLVENIFAEIKFPLEGLKYRFNYGLTTNRNYYNGYEGRGTAGGRNVGGSASRSHGDGTSWILENIVNYEKTFQKHALHFTGLYSAESGESQYFGVGAYNFLNDDLKYYALNTASNYNKPSSSYSAWTFTSLMGRINYKYDNKYLLTLTYRRDGYSAFGNNNKFGNFPSAALAWIMSEENFMKNLAFVSNLKTRFSWGKNGNQAISAYSSKVKIGSAGNYSFGDKLLYGFAPQNIANNNLGWETTSSFNLGIDIGIFENRINASIDYYHTKTSDLLLTRAIPTSTGFSSIMDNIGKTQNDGVELLLNTLNINQAGGLKWNSIFNFSYNKNKIVELYGDKKDDIGNSWFIGKPINVYYDYVFDGIWQESDDIANSHDPTSKPGSVRVKDISGPDGVPDGVITAQYDRKIIGKHNPDFTWGLTNSFQYKGFDFSFFLQGAHGVTGYHDLKPLSNYMNMLNIDHWLPESPSKRYPTGIIDRQNSYTEKANYHDASYVRVKDITLGYTLSNDVIRKIGIGIDRMHLYVNFVDMFTFTKWPLTDPESVFYKDPVGSYRNPMAKSYIIGLNVSF